MARLKILTDYINGEKYFLDPATGMGFRKIAASLVWPHKERQGCVIVLGESRGKPNEYGQTRHDVHKLAEMTNASPDSLVDFMRLLTEAFYVAIWATPICDKRVCLIDDMNFELKKQRRPKIRYADPQGFTGKGEGLLPFYHSLVQRRTQNEKTLYLGDGSCADEIAAFAYEDKSTPIMEYPSAAALCFALAEIDVGPRFGGKVNTGVFGPADGLGGY